MSSKVKIFHTVTSYYDVSGWLRSSSLLSIGALEVWNDSLLSISKDTLLIFCWYCALVMMIRPIPSRDFFGCCFFLWNGYQTFHFWYFSVINLCIYFQFLYRWYFFRITSVTIWAKHLSRCEVRSMFYFLNNHFLLCLWTRAPCSHLFSLKTDQ